MTDHSLIGATLSDPLAEQDRLFAEDVGRTAAALVKADPTGKRLEDFTTGLAYQDQLLRRGVPEALHPFLVRFAKLPKPESRTARRARFAAAIAERVAVNGYFSDEDAERLGMTPAEIRDLKLEAWRASGANRMAA